MGAGQVVDDIDAFHGAGEVGIGEKIAAKFLDHGGIDFWYGRQFSQTAGQNAHRSLGRQLRDQPAADESTAAQDEDARSGGGFDGEGRGSRDWPEKILQRRLTPSH